MKKYREERAEKEKEKGEERESPFRVPPFLTPGGCRHLDPKARSPFLLFRVPPFSVPTAPGFEAFTPCTIARRVVLNNNNPTPIVQTHVCTHTYTDARKQANCVRTYTGRRTRMLRRALSMLPVRPRVARVILYPIPRRCVLHS